MRLESGFRIVPNWPKIRKITMISQFANMTSSSTFLDVILFLLSSLVYWSKFHVNIITGSGVMTIYFYKGLTRNPEIGNTLVWVLPNIWKLGQVSDTKLGTQVSNEMLLNVRVTALTISELLRENQHEGGGGEGLPPHPD